MNSNVVLTPFYEEKAERIVGEELKRRRWTESSLAGRGKSDPEKVEMALRLQMGSWTNVSNSLSNKSK